MKKTVETSFKRIETKYVVNKEDLDDLLKDLKKYVVEDDYPDVYKRQPQGGGPGEPGGR